MPLPDRRRQSRGRGAANDGASGVRGSVQRIPRVSRERRRAMRRVAIRRRVDARAAVDDAADRFPPEPFSTAGPYPGGGCRAGGQPISVHRHVGADRLERRRKIGDGDGRSACGDRHRRQARGDRLGAIAPTGAVSPFQGFVRHMGARSLARRLPVRGGGRTGGGMALEPRSEVRRERADRRLQLVSGPTGELGRPPRTTSTFFA